MLDLKEWPWIDATTATVSVVLLFSQRHLAFHPVVPSVRTPHNLYVREGFAWRFACVPEGRSNRHPACIPGDMWSCPAQQRMGQKSAACRLVFLAMAPGRSGGSDGGSGGCRRLSLAFGPSLLKHSRKRTRSL